MGVPPKVGLFSVWYNRAEEVEPSIESVLNQSYGDIRFVLVDDGSSDSTLDRLREVAARHKHREIEVLTWPNRGFTASLIAAIGSTRCEYVAIHDAGDISHPSRIEKQVAAAAADPAAAIIGAHVGVYMDGVTSQEAERMARDLSAGPPPPDHVPMPGTHGAVLFRRDLYDQVGGYRAAFRYCQDSDLWLRMLPLGSMRIVPELLHWRYESEQSISGTPRKQIVQRHYMELAQQCADARAAGCADPVDLYRADAVFFLRHTRRFSSSLHDLSKRLMRKGHDEEARIAARLALQYAPSLTKLRAARQILRLSRHRRASAA